MYSKLFIKPVSATVLALVTVIALNPRLADAQATCAQEIASIQAYSKRIDKLIKQKQNPPSKRIFARLPSNVRERAGEWVELADDSEKTIAGFAESAFAWAIGGTMVAAQITLENTTRDSVHRVLYYYREDGTLAQITSTLTSFAGANIIVREEFYDRTGVALSKSSRHYTRRVSRSEPGKGAVEEPIPVYLRINEFPFYREMGRFGAL